METKKVHSIESVSLFPVVTDPSSLIITVKGENLNSNYTNIRLEPFVYVQPPLNGIWEFTMVGEVPPITDNLVTHVGTQYLWQDFPKNAKGIRVYSQTNSKSATIRGIHHGKVSTTDGIQIIRAEAVLDMEPMHPAQDGTLTVSLDYNSNNHGFHNLRKAMPQGINPRILLLELTNEPEDIFIFNPRHSTYSQGNTAEGQYTSIEILYEGALVATITSIPVLV
jgi:hypothetical protein